LSALFRCRFSASSGAKQEREINIASAMDNKIVIQRPIDTSLSVAVFVISSYGEANGKRNFME
jgi:hypothetical protein